MKKIILTIAGLLSITYGTIAQNKFAFGVKGGTNYATVYDSEGEDFDADGKLGFAAGAFLTIPLGQYIGIQPELMFSQKGFKARGTMFGTPYEMKRTSNYIDLP